MRMRKKKHATERMKALLGLFVPTEEKKLVNCQEIFGNSHPLCLEIGCGKGDFVKQLSRREGDKNFIAMEKVEDVIVIAAEKYAGDRGLGALAPNGGWKKYDGEIVPMGESWDIPEEMKGNVRFMRADAANIAEYFSPESVETVYANFSDPWTKYGYSARRLTHGNFLASYNSILVPGGTFSFKTDNTELFEFSVEAVKSSPLELVFVTDDLHASPRAEGNIMTEYERNFTEKGVKIHMLEARKMG